MNDQSQLGRHSQENILVEDMYGRRPFMRGILVHSLMSKGLTFEESYDAANLVREKVRIQRVVTRKELGVIVRRVVGSEVAEVNPVTRSPDIVVTGGSGGVPFSKGFLSQSLLSAAIEPGDAFEVARNIEDQLIARKTQEIDRRKLRSLVYQALHSRAGERSAQRYLVWRYYQEPDRPVILLLGGTTGSGKTSLAVEVAYRLGIARIISTDSIRQVMRLMLSSELVPAIHRSSYDAYRVLSKGDHNDAIIDGFRAQAEAVSVGVRAMIGRAISESEHLVMDGVSLVPGLLNLQDYAKSAEIIFLMVAAPRGADFESRFETRAKRAKERTPHGYLENIENILHIQDYLLKLSEEHDIPIVDNDSFDRSVVSIIRTVTEQLRKRSGTDASRLL